MSYYLFSTLTFDNLYVIYKKTDVNANPVIEKKVLIKGGHLMATKSLITPKGIMTEISDEDFEVLKQDYGFIQHEKNGFLKVEKKKMDAEKASISMEQKDGSTPKTPEDFEKSESGMGNTYKSKGKK